MIKGYRLKIFPKEEQKQLLQKSFGSSRFIYNWCIDEIQNHYKITKKHLSKFELSNRLTALKKVNSLSWLNEISTYTLRHSIFDCTKAYKRWFDMINKNGVRFSQKVLKRCDRENRKPIINESDGFPRYKSRKSEQKCPTRPERMTFKGRYVHLEKIGDVKLAKVKLDLNGKIMNSRIHFDGVDYWLSFSIEYSDIQKNIKSKTQPKTEPIGIDLGLTTLVYCSNQMKFKKPYVKKLDKKIKRFQRRASKIYQPMIDYCMKTKTKFSTLVKSNNLIKLEKKLRKYQIKKTNILISNIHKVTSELIKLNPERIVIENLNVEQMKKVHHMARLVKDAKFYEIKRQLIYKCRNNDINLVIADRWYPSSKTCSNCGTIKYDLKLKDRIFRCPHCGTVIDRDLNAAINLSKIS